MNGLARRAAALARHPLVRRRPFAALVRIARWQLGTRILGGPAVVPFTGRTRMLLERGMTGATGNLYCGLHDFEGMSFVGHFLRPGDLFVDVGANVGAYTVLASGEAGADTVAIEPDPATFAALEDNVALNRLGSRVRAIRSAVGPTSGVVELVGGLGTRSHVAPATTARATRTVATTTLDRILEDRAPAMVKLDVEGWELEALRGGAGTLVSPALMAMLVELDGSGRRYGLTDDATHRHLVERGFAPVRYVVSERRLEALESWNRGQRNTLYLRRFEEVRLRLSSSKPLELPFCRV